MAKINSDPYDFSVLLDTNFLIYLINKSSDCHSNAKSYFKFFIDHKIPMYVSTISIAEFCVHGSYSELPLGCIRILPFNAIEAVAAGEYAQILYYARNNNEWKPEDRKIIPNDTKLFAQVGVNHRIKYFVTGDTKSAKPIDIIRKTLAVPINHLDIHYTPGQAFGFLDL